MANTRKQHNDNQMLSYNADKNQRSYTLRIKQCNVHSIVLQVNETQLNVFIHWIVPLS